MRLIDGDALKESLKQSRDACKTWFDNCDSDMKPRVEQALITFIECIIRVNDAPTVEERKMGKWITKEGDVCFHDVCSECGKKYVHSYPHYNYCPNCGADMRETE